MTDVAAVIPVLGRPWRIVPLIAALLESLEDVSVDLLFVASPEDEPELTQLRRVLGPAGYRAGDVASYVVTPEPRRAGDWARKVNLGYAITSAPWVFTGADDLCFCPGWADRAIECSARTGAGVVGTQDGVNLRVVRGEHATHNLVARRYADEFGTVDGPGAVVTEVYAHNYVDDELVSTAKARGTWTFCADAEVPHRHPNYFADVERDATYLLGDRDFQDDARLFRRRQGLFRGLRPVAAHGV